MLLPVAIFRNILLKIQIPDALGLAEGSNCSKESMVALAASDNASSPSGHSMSVNAEYR